MVVSRQPTNDKRQLRIAIVGPVYPYRAGQNNLATIIPPWAHEGGSQELIKRLKDPALRASTYGAPPALPPWADAKEFAVAQRPENHAFRESLLGPGEQAYLRVLGDIERRRKK